MWIKRFVCFCFCFLLIYSSYRVRGKNEREGGRNLHIALGILTFLLVTHTAVILLDELVVALHQTRVVSRDMMRLELIERYVGDLDDHIEPCAAVVIVHRHV